MIGNQADFFEKKCQTVGTHPYQPKLNDRFLKDNKKYKPHTSSNGMSFVSRSIRRGFMPAMLSYLLTFRAEIKTKMKDKGMSARAVRALGKFPIFFVKDYRSL